MNPLQIHNLQFGYNKEKRVLNGLNLSVPEASIYGFLGPNGAGKSTTIRTLLGLLRPHAGEVLLWGEPLRAGRPQLYGRLGALVEAPSFYPQLSASDNLRLIGKYHGVNDRQRIRETLARVGLAAPAHQAARKFSTGMKQRLGLAMAMLSQPELLILDEPTNGLDPSGISEIRQLMLELQQQGTTIFLSSHLLHEVEKIASRVGILREGQIAFEGSLAELQGLRNNRMQLRLRVSKPEEVASLFPQLTVVREGHEVHVTLSAADEVPKILRTLIGAGHDVYEAAPQASALEELFLEVTHNPTAV